MSEVRAFLSWLLRVLKTSTTKTTPLILDLIGVFALVAKSFVLPQYTEWLQAGWFVLAVGVIWAMYCVHKEQSLELDRLRLKRPDIRLSHERTQLATSAPMPGPPNDPKTDCLYTEWHLSLKVRNQGRGQGLLYKPQAQVDWGDAPLQYASHEPSWRMRALASSWPVEIAPEDWGPTILCSVQLVTTVRGYEAIADHWDEFVEMRINVRYEYKGLDGKPYCNKLEVPLSFEELKEDVFRHARLARRDRGGSR